MRVRKNPAWSETPLADKVGSMRSLTALEIVESVNAEVREQILKADAEAMSRALGEAQELVAKLERAVAHLQDELRVRNKALQDIAWTAESGIEGEFVE